MNASASAAVSAVAAPCPYSVAGIKSFQGREGYGFNATLLCNGRKVAFVRDMANGGCLDFDWLAKDRALAAADEAALETYCASLPGWSLRDANVAAGLTLQGEKLDELLPMDADMLLSRLVEAEENRRKLARHLKKKVLFVDPANASKSGGVRCFTCAPTPANLAAIAAKYPTYLVLNSMPADEAFALFAGAGN